MDCTTIPASFQRHESQIWAALHGGEVHLSESRPEATLTYGELLDADARWLSLPASMRKRRRRLSWRLAVASVLHDRSLQPPPLATASNLRDESLKPRVGRNGRVLRKRGGR